MKDLLKALQLTIEFEAQLNKRYEKHVSIHIYIVNSSLIFNDNTSSKMMISVSPCSVSINRYLFVSSPISIFTLMQRMRKCII